MKLNSRFSNYGAGITLLVGFLLSGILCFAQDCDPKELANIPGVYKGPGKGSTSAVAKTDLDRQQAVTRKFMSMVVDNYKPKGMNIGYGPAYYPPLPYLPNGINVGNHYQAVFYLMYFYCSYQNKMEQIAETHSIIEIRVNEWDYPHSFFVRKAIDEEDPETDVFATIKHKPVCNENGYWTMTDTVYVAGRDITNFHHLVTHNKKLPFIYMSKKDYLTKLRKNYEERIEVTINEWKNPTPEEAEYAKERIEGDKSYYGKSIRNIDNFLANSTEEVLNEPATVVSGVHSEFEDFAVANYFVITPNPAYYNSKAPKSTAHFIDVLFKIYEPEVACLNAKNDILKIIDFKVLQEIVDKGGVQAATGNAPAAKPVVKPAANLIKK